MPHTTSASSDPPDHYALDILTQAAMQTTVNSSSRNPSIGTRNQPVADSYNPSMLSSHDMDALGFGSSPQTGGQHSYLSQTYPEIGAQLSMSHADDSLKILNAESYDDGYGMSRDIRWSTKSKSPLPFGVSEQVAVDLARVAGAEDHDSGPKRKKRRVENHSAEDEEETKVKVRGRPRVTPKDETAADRRRTQIRMAQRAYRNRKESTISSLEKKVQDLTEVNEEMSKIFINLYDFAVSKGLLQREPDFGQQLQSSTKKFLELARASADDTHDENQEDSPKGDEAEHSRRPQGRKTSKSPPKKIQKEVQPVSLVSPVPGPSVSQPALTYGGYIVSEDENVDMDMAYTQEDHYRDDQYEANQYGARSSDIQIITRPTQDNASFPVDFMDLQQYRVEFPQTDEFSRTFLPQSQLPLPKSYAYNEYSFSRRIQRGALERSFRIITSNDPSMQEIARRVFRFTLMYNTKEAIIARMKRLLASSTKDSLQEWRAPFLHVGGSGTYYPVHESEATWDLMPKFRTGYSMGPFSPSVAQVQEVLDDDMKCCVPGLEGNFFDPNDVEGYLRGRGVDIAPAADFVTVELDLLGLSEASTPKSSSSESIMSMVTPRTPESLVENAPLDVEKISNAFGLDLAESSYGDIVPVTQRLPFPLGFAANWDNDSSMKASNGSIDPIFNAEPYQNANMAETTSGRGYDSKRTVTINVNVLLDEIIKRGVCLGRGAGFRAVDVEAALIAAVQAGS